MRRIKIRCKTCNKALGEFELDREIKFIIKCPRCRSNNIGTIKDINKNKK